MKPLARLMRSSRPARIAAMVFTFLLPLTNVISAAILANSARATGWRNALADLLAGLIIVAGLAQLTGAVPATTAALTAGLGAAALWGGALLAGTLFRRFSSVDLVLQALVVVALTGVVVAELAIPDARTRWQPVVQRWFEGSGLVDMASLPDGWAGTVAELMHGVIGASLLSTLMIGLLVALWLDPPDPGTDWQRQFRGLRLGRVLSVAGLAATGLLAAGFRGLGGGLLLVLVTGFVAQGLAIVHWTAARRGWPRPWPVAIYGLLVLGPAGGVLLLALAAAGFVDNWVGLRREQRDVV